MALDPQRGRGASWRGGDRRLSTETKHSSKTTEFIAYLAVLAGILIASAMISDDDGGGGEGGGDYFTADEAWRLVTFLTIGYMIARGLAKSGSREPYWEGGSNAERGDDDDDRDREGGRGATVGR